MLFGNAVAPFAGANAVGLLCLLAGFPASAQAGESADFYEFTDPNIAEVEPIISGASKVIPKPIRITGFEFHNPTLHPSVNAGNVEITYTMPEPGFVTIRVAREGTRELYLATILNMAFRDAGTHTETWDGRNFYGESLYELNIPFSYSLQAESPASGSPPPGYEGLEYAEGESQEEAIAKAEWNRHIHTWHEGKFEHIPLLAINSPTSGDQVSGKVVVRSGVDRVRRGFGDKYGYGVRYYVDSEIIHEEFYVPESGGQFSFELDTTAFDDGAHTLHVGMCDHNDHVTSHGIEVVFNNLGE